MLSGKTRHVEGIRNSEANTYSLLVMNATSSVVSSILSAGFSVYSTFDEDIRDREVLEQRFAYDGVRGLHVAMVRIYAVEPALEIADRPGFGGCRSWIRLPDLIESPTFRPVLSDTEHQRRAALVKLAVGS